MLSDELLDENQGMFKRQRAALLINHMNEVISKNLFQILCVIMRLPPISRGHNCLEPQVFNAYLATLDERQRSSPETLLFEQLMMLKRLINRPLYSLNSQ